MVCVCVREREFIQCVCSLRVCRGVYGVYVMCGGSCGVWGGNVWYVYVVGRVCKV